MLSSRNWRRASSSEKGAPGPGSANGSLGGWRPAGSNIPRGGRRRPPPPRPAGVSLHTASCVAVGMTPAESALLLDEDEVHLSECPVEGPNVATEEVVRDEPLVLHVRDHVVQLRTVLHELEERDFQDDDLGTRQAPRCPGHRFDLATLDVDLDQIRPGQVVLVAEIV